MNKRGVTVQQTLIAIVILLISAGIIFLFIKYLPYKEMVKKQACHQSVLLRSKTLAGMQPGKLLVPLNCKTEYITISTSNEAQIKREIANAMYDCWWMLGEGKLDFIEESKLKELTFAPAKSYCVICSIIKFEKGAKNKKIELEEYLGTTKIPEKNMTYLEYFMNGEGELPPDVHLEPLDTNNDVAILYFFFESEPLWKGLAADAAIAAASFGGSFLFGAVRGGISGGWRAMVSTGSLYKKVFGVSKVEMAKQIGTKLTVVRGPEAEKLGAILFDEFGKLVTVKKEAETATVTVVRGLGRFTIPATIAGMISQTGVAWEGQARAAGFCDGERKGCFQLVVTPLDPQSLSYWCQNIESVP